MKNFKEMKYLLLDLDGVCYGKHNNYSLEKVFGQVSQRMTMFISERLKIDMEEAKKLQTDYFYKYNTSLNGLMIHHDIPPEEFLRYVHTIDLSFMKEDKIMRNELEKLDMEKLINQEWLNNIENSSKEFILSLKKQNVFRFNPAKRNLTYFGNNLELGFSCFALKIYYILGLWDELENEDKVNWLNYINSFQVESKKFPNKDLLDQHFPEIPVILSRVDGHALLVNQTAFH